MSEPTQVIAVRAWFGGPLRQMSASKVSGTFIPVVSIENRGFAGRYVCDKCLEPSKGVFRRYDSQMSGKQPSEEQIDRQNGGVEWVCESCLSGKARVTRTPEEREQQRQALAARFARARQTRTEALQEN